MTAGIARVAEAVSAPATTRLATAVWIGRTNASLGAFVLEVGAPICETTTCSQTFEARGDIGAQTAGRSAAMQGCKMAAAIYALVGLSALMLLRINGDSVFGMGPDPVLDAFGRALGMPWILAAPLADSSTEMLVWEAAAIALNVFVIIGLGWLMRAKR